MPKKNHKSNSSLGKSLANKAAAVKQSKIAPSQEGFKIHTTDLIAPTNKPSLKTILEQNSLDEFVNLAEMSNKKFEALRRGDATIIDNNQIIPGVDGQERIGIMNKFLNEDTILKPSYTALKIPRRPKWTKEMTALEIQNQENLAFLEWRRDIAQMEENNVKMAITPFEKNIEVWKQLWRVIEKSDILLQIVDARNPYFFYSADLEKYIQEHEGNKEFILCINKADYLSDELIEHWNQYFNDKNVTHIFISAKKEQEKLDQLEDSEESSEDEFGVNKEEEEKDFEPMFDDLKKKIDIENELNEGKPIPQEEIKGDEIEIKFNSTTIFSRDQMLKVLQLKVKQFGKNYNDRLMVGTVGYPNVGKSSLINVLCGKKRVGVAAMPGKTKHFQTLLLENDARDLCLVDCPGLVFPSFANSKAEMYCCGVLPIQNIREYMSPVSLVVSRIQKYVLEVNYKIKLPERNHKKYTTTTFLSLFALQKGWITGGSSNPDMAVAAKRVLVDYTTGVIVFCHVRPDFDSTKHKAVKQSGFNLPVLETIPEQIDAQDYEPLEDDQEEKIDVITDQISKDQQVRDGANDMRTGKGTGIYEEDLDKAFFNKHVSQDQMAKMKLNKGEKRALKFLLKKQGDLQPGQQIDLKKLTSTGDIADLKNMLALQSKKHRETENEGKTEKHKDYIETGGGHKSKNFGKRRGVGNNSNKMSDYKEFFKDDSD